MVGINTVVITLVVAATQVSAFASPPFKLFGRQTSGLGDADIPTQCQATCGPVENTLNTCTEVSCLCTASITSALATCVDCLVAVAGGTAASIAQGQSIVDQFSSACNTAGATVSSILVSSVLPSGASNVAPSAVGPTTSNSIAFSTALPTSVSVLPPILSQPLPSGSGTTASGISFAPTTATGGGGSSTVLNPTNTPKSGSSKNALVGLGGVISLGLGAVAMVFL